MKKTFSKFEIATIKRTAQSVNPMVSKKIKLAEQIAELQAEYNQLSQMQEQYEASIKTMTGGYGTEDLVEKVIEPSSSVDKNGKVIKITKYVLKYPETIIPVNTVVTETVNIDSVDDTEKAPEVEVAAGEVAPINPIDAWGTLDNNI